MAPLEGPFHESHEKNEMNLVYILSPSFSGSTLLTFILDRHDAIHTFGELKATAMGPLDMYYCSCGLPIKQCQFWTNLQNRCQKRGIPFTLDNFGTHFTSTNRFWAKIMGAQVRNGAFEAARRVLLRVTPGLHKEYTRILKQNSEVISAFIEDSENDWFLDGSKDPSRLMYLARSQQWQIKVLKLYRDGRAQSNSYRKKYKTSIKVAAREWESEMKQIHRVSNMIPSSDVIEVRYEDLCAAPQSTMESIWGQLGLEPANIDWEKPLHTYGSHILGNNNMRQNTKVAIRLDESWRDELLPEDIKWFDRIAGHTNRGLGYN